MYVYTAATVFYQYPANSQDRNTAIICSARTERTHTHTQIIWQRDPDTFTRWPHKATSTFVEHQSVWIYYTSATQCTTVHVDNKICMPLANYFERTSPLTHTQWLYTPRIRYNAHATQWTPLFPVFYTGIQLPFSHCNKNSPRSEMGLFL